MKYKLKNFIGCTPEEHSLILSWRNSESVRLNSHTDSIISAAQHNNFVGALKHTNEKKYFLVATNELYIGVINFVDITEDSAYVGYYKGQGVATKGVGKELLQIASEYAKDMLHIKHLYAEVIGENVASHKSMERADFKLVSCENNISLYIKNLEI